MRSYGIMEMQDIASRLHELHEWNPFYVMWHECRCNGSNLDKVSIFQVDAADPFNSNIQFIMTSSTVVQLYILITKFHVVL
jgi:hypothetical protein